MALTILFLLIKCSFIQASQLVHYKFGSNFGQIFFDYSGSGNHGQNGQSIDSDSCDTIPFDRGAYFSAVNNKYILLPPNDIKSTPFYLMSSFSIIIWAYFMQDGHNCYLTYRIAANGNYLYIYRMSDFYRFLIDIIYSGNHKFDYSSVYNTASSGIR
jgi:hypothetical protein